MISIGISEGYKLMDEQHQTSNRAFPGSYPRHRGSQVPVPQRMRQATHGRSLPSGRRPWQAALRRYRPAPVLRAVRVTTSGSVAVVDALLAGKPPVKAHDSHGAETGLHASKPLFRALLTQLHPGHDWNRLLAALNKGGVMSTCMGYQQGKGLENA